MKLKNIILLIITIYSATPTTFAMDKQINKQTDIDKKVEELIEEIANISLNENKIQLSKKAYQEISQDCEEQLNKKNRNELIKLAKKIDLKKLNQQFSSHNNKKKNNTNKSEVPKTSVQNEKQTQKISQNKNNTSKNKSKQNSKNKKNNNNHDFKILNQAIYQNNQSLAQQDKNGNTALHRAVIDNNFDLMQSCLVNKIHLKGLINNDGLTAYALALKLKKGELKEDILSFFEENGYSKYTASIAPVHEISSVEELSDYTQKELLRKTNKGENLLHLLCQKNDIDNFDLIKELVENHHFSCDEQDFYTYETPLHSWMNDKHPYQDKEVIALYLLKHMKKVDQIDCNQETLLHHAAACNYYNVVRELINRGAYIDAQNEDNDTPLHFAVMYSSLESIGILLNAEALIKKPNDELKIAFECVSKKASEKTKEFIRLIQWKAKEEPRYGTFHHYCLNESKENIENLFKMYKFFPCNGRDDHGLTPLMYAIKKERVDIIQLIIAQGCRLDLRDFEGNNILHYAYATANNDIKDLIIKEIHKKNGLIEILLAQKNSNGKTPTTFALEKFNNN